MIWVSGAGQSAVIIGWQGTKLWGIIKDKTVCCRPGLHQAKEDHKTPGDHIDDCADSGHVSSPIIQWPQPLSAS